MAQRTSHGNNLSFVMKRMGQDMMKDERRSADGDVPIREMKFRIRVELLIRHVRQICLGQPADFLLQESRIGDGRTFLSTPVDVREALERVNPKSFAVENVNHLFTQRVKAEVGQFLHIIACGDCGQMIQDKIQAGMGPAMEFPNTIEGEH
jgi:hypothetical protein